MATFTGKRVITMGVNNEIPESYQNIMWSMIISDINKKQELDYLQIFELKPSYDKGKMVQMITKKQEQPRRESVRTVISDNPISAKIFVIDDISHITMLLSHEY